jgi:hypothetical protein
MGTSYSEEKECDPFGCEGKKEEEDRIPRCLVKIICCLNSIVYEEEDQIPR